MCTSTPICFLAVLASGCAFTRLRARCDATDRRCDAVLSTDPSRLPELLAKSVTDAHRNTLRCPSDYIQKMLRKPHDLGKLSYYSKLVGGDRSAN